MRWVCARRVKMKIFYYFFLLENLCEKYFPRDEVNERKINKLYQKWYEVRKKMRKKCCGSEVGSHESFFFSSPVEDKSVTDNEKSN